MLKNKKNNKDKSAKSRNKRILTIYSSQNSHLEILPKSTTVVLKKATKTSVPNLNSQQKQQPKKQKSRQQTIVMKKAPVENYERIPLYFVNSDTNSEIQFSNLGETKKQSNKYSKDWRISCGHQEILKQIWGNKKGVKKVDKRKKSPQVQNRAATKIQKVFRGYLTRKLLMKYVQEYEQKLLIEKQRLKNQIKMRKSQLSLFPSRKQSKKIQYSPSSELFEPEQRENPLQMQSSIMIADEQIGNSQFAEEDPLHNASHQTYEIPEHELQSDRLQEQQFQLGRQQEISLSFGHQNQNSPHFLKIHKKRNSKQISKSSFEQQPRKKHYISDDKTGQGFSQNISSCPSHSKNTRIQRQSSSHKSSVMRQQQNQNQHATQRDLAFFENLRSAQKAKWQQVISLVNSQMKQGINQQKTRELMSLILQFSLKNREELNNKNSQQIMPTNLVDKSVDLKQQVEQQKQAFKKKKWNEGEQQLEKIKRNQNMPLARRPKQDKSLLQRTSNMKQYFLKNLRIQDTQIDKMMQVRQAVLRKKQGKSLQQLNDLLQNHDLSQDDFIDRMSLLTSRFIRYKKQIQQTKNEIYQGYKAQVQLFKQTILDAKSLGYQVPFCRSMQIYPNYSQWRFDDVMIDELNQHSQRRSRRVYITDGEGINISSKQFQRSPKFTIEQIHIQNVNEQRQKFEKSPSDSQEEDSANFSYEETNIYNNFPPIPKRQQDNGENQAILSPKNLKKVSVFSRFSSVPFCQFGQFQGAEKRLHNSQQKQNSQQQEQQYLSLKRMPKKQTFKIQFSSDQQQQLILYHQSSDKKVEELTNNLFNKVIFQTLEDLFKSDKILQTLNVHNKAARKILKPISKQQRLSFLSHCLRFIPNFLEVQNRLNQKMYPNRKELLISMRENIDELQSDHEYYEIGHYEYILNQQTCFQMIDTYIETHKIKNNQKQDNFQKIQMIRQQIQQYASPKLKKYLQNYGYNSQIKRREAFQLRQQVLKIELHLMLDVWNEQLIKYRENKVGYSGIGLNQITFSLIDRVCRPINRQIQWVQMISKTKQSIQSVIKSQNLNTKLISQYEQFVSKNDSQWIYYSQQGLEFGFDLTKVLEVELIFQLLQQLHIINEDRDNIIEQSSVSEESKQSQLQKNHNIRPEEEDYFEDSQNQFSDNGQQGDYFEEDQLQLNEDQEHILEQKMKQLETINVGNESEDSFDD